MPKKLLYLFDPLCGWCYAVEKTVSRLASEPDLGLEMFPTGLFSGSGARVMDDNFASYAWANHQRIAQLTGQIFSDRYLHRVLGKKGQRFDSGPATLALTAVARISPEQEIEALSAIQHARFVDGIDVADQESLAEVLTENRLEKAAALLVESGQTLTRAAEERIAHARALMERVNAQGIPAFIFSKGGETTLLAANTIISDPDGFVDRLITA